MICIYIYTQYTPHELYIKLVDERHGCEDRLVHEALSGAV